MLEASKLGAAARSDRAEAALRRDVAAGRVGPRRWTNHRSPSSGAGDRSPSRASLPGAAAATPSLAAQVAAAAGLRVVERFEVMTMSTPAVYRFLPFTRRGLVAELRDDTAAATGDLPQRASIKLDVTLSGGLGGASTTTRAGRSGRRRRARPPVDRPPHAAARRHQRRTELPRRRRLRRAGSAVAADPGGRRRRRAGCGRGWRSSSWRPAPACRSRCRPARRCRSCASTAAPPASWAT